MAVIAPAWLWKIVGNRERAILLAEDAYVTNFVEDVNSDSTERFPIRDNLLSIVSPKEGRFMIDTKRKLIVG